MAYYRKKHVKAKIEEANQKLIDSKKNSLTPIEESLMQLENEEDLVSFSWIYENPKAEIGMETIILARLSHNLYTDDRYVIDSYASLKEGVDVIEYINKKLKAIETAYKQQDIAKEINKRIQKNKKSK